MRNSGPEKKITEEAILDLGLSLGFDFTVIDTAAVWNPIAQKFQRRQASESLPDLIGNHGRVSVWVELKAPGRRSAVNQSKDQRKFLIRKIKSGCFACVTDGPVHFRALWIRWQRCQNEAERYQLLMNDLPAIRDPRQRTFEEMP